MHIFKWVSYVCLLRIGMKIEISIKIGKVPGLRGFTQKWPAAKLWHTHINGSSNSYPFFFFT